MAIEIFWSIKCEVFTTMIYYRWPEKHFRAFNVKVLQSASNHYTLGLFAIKIEDLKEYTCEIITHKWPNHHNVIWWNMWDLNFDIRFKINTTISKKKHSIDWVSFKFVCSFFIANKQVQVELLPTFYISSVLILPSNTWKPNFVLNLWFSIYFHFFWGHQWYQCLSARLQYLQCVGRVDTKVLL